MIKINLIALLLIVGNSISAQSAIFGEIDFENSNTREQKVYLSKFDGDHLEDLKYAKEIAWSPIAADGSFSFDQKHIAAKDAVYRLYVKEMDKAISDTICSSKAFILSGSDRMQFYKGKPKFSNYITTNLADREWQRLREFEEKLLRSQVTGKNEASQLKSYAKDSLRILMVKLIGIQHLEEKRLLDQDIAKNPKYYLTLLEELKESDMPPSQYLFLEKKLAFLTQETLEQKYAWSKAVNFILGFLVLGLGAIMVLRRERQPLLAHLSKQERNVKKLILQGKTNKEIAIELFISLSTVKTHITNIYSKLQVSSRQELLQKTQKS